ncbi:LB_137 family protein [Leptospira tipperaryensis]|nr:hypothetical protein [Leptospira tipperaryensis]
MISLCVILFSQESFADTILLKDNTTLIGRVLEYKERSIRFENAYETIEIPSNQIVSIEIGFNGIRTTLKTKSDPDVHQWTLIHSESNGKFTFYDKRKSKLLIIEFKDIESLEYEFPFDKNNFRSVVGGYEVEIISKKGERKSGVLSAIRSNTTVLLSNSKEISISNSGISKIVYKNKQEKDTENVHKHYNIKLYYFVLPGLYQIRTKRISFGTFLLLSTLLSAGASQYEYERGKNELQKQREFNERSILFGKELGLINSDFNYEAYYEHKNHNRSFLILTSVFYIINLLDLWTWKSISTKNDNSSFQILPSFRFPIGADRFYPNGEIDAQVRFQWTF